MSNDKSIITNLVNKVSYKLQKASYDPEADEYAQKKEEKARPQHFSGCP